MPMETNLCQRSALKLYRRVFEPLGYLTPDFIHKTVDGVEYHVPVLFNRCLSVVPAVERFGAQS